MFNLGCTIFERECQMFLDPLNTKQHDGSNLCFIFLR